MRKFIILIMLLWIIPVTALASPILNNVVPIQLDGNGNPYGEYVNSGDLVTIMSGNDEGKKHFDLLNAHMSTAYGIVLVPIDVVYSGDGYTGIWDTTDMAAFYTIKAGDNFALYWVNPEDNYGSWSTHDLWLSGACSGDSLEISHLNAYQASPVPIPATLLLFGSGLLGIIGIKRKRLL